MTTNAEIEKAEELLRQAMLSSDAQTLDGLLAEEAVFTNQDGVRLSRADDLATHRSGLLAIDRLDAKAGPDIRVIGDAAVVLVTVEQAGRYDGQPFGGTFAYTRVWHRRDGRWRVEAAHCSAAPAA